MPCIHFDLYVANSNFGEWHIDHLRRVIIEGRLARKRPIIVEGCLLIRAVAQINRKPDFLVFVENTAFSGSESLGGRSKNIRPKRGRKSLLTSRSGDISMERRSRRCRRLELAAPDSARVLAGAGIAGEKRRIEVEPLHSHHDAMHRAVPIATGICFPRGDDGAELAAAETALLA
jgi:hypothetical protein